MEKNIKIIKGKKKEMTQVFLPDGTVVPVTIVVTEESVEDDLKDKNITLTGTSKGKGFAGVMKKWNFKGGPATRGQSDTPRAPGAIGSQTPSKVFKGKKMAGRMGNKKVTLRGLKIMDINKDLNELFVYGPIPGARNSKVTIKVVS